MPRCRTDCIEKPFSRLFEKLGHVVGSSLEWFIIIPLLMSIGFGGGLFFLAELEDNDIETQFTPIDGLSKTARLFVMENFPNNDSMFSSQRLYTEGKYAVMILSTENGGNILTKSPFEEVIRINKKVTSLSVKVGQRQVGFKDLCTTMDGKCVSNAIVDISENNADKIGQINITFPVHTFRNKPIFLGSELGGVKTSGNRIQNAQAIRLFYFLKNVPSSNEWLKEFHQVLYAEANSKKIKISHFTSLSRQEEVQKHTTDGLPFFSITYVLAIAFSVISCMRLDNVRNRLWVAFVGVISAGLAVISSFGLLLYAGVPFVITVANSPFLILGIGVDDMFIMLAKWQQTNVRDSVEKRMADTYKEAAMSITITTLTNVLGFYIGLMSDFASVQIFCLYTSTAIIFCFLYNITFFGGFLALNGRREAGNRHWLTCLRIPFESPVGKSKAYALCCTGGDYDRQTGTEKEQPVNHFFKKYYGPILTKTPTKVCVIFLYLGYLAAGIYGCFLLEQGIEMKHLAADDSYVITFYDEEKKYFSSYGPNIMVVVTEEFPYWDKCRRSELDRCMEDFNKLHFVNKDLYTSWLDYYVTFTQNTGQDVNNETVFKTNLPNFFNLLPEFEQDVNIVNGTIIASRFFVQTINIVNATMEITMFNELRDTAEYCKAAKLLVFHPMFIYLDQYTVIVSSTVQNVGVTAAVMLVISLILIPNPLCSLWVTFSIGSVITGVAGFMALWKVNLDSISMIILVVCIGFTVDFSAHISYSFVSSKKETANERAIDALSCLGYPILQGALSTIIGVLVLAGSKNHIFRTFFKIMFLVMVFGLLHGIVFIPVFLTWFSCSSNKRHDNRETCNEEYSIQSIRTTQTQIYATQNSNQWSGGMHDPDCP
ncbi:patched domain-containing protein 3 [Pangasianodon hypophthalmus]|uniref:patched domain-containing protein 3 n=1 Tax=Pangasianodon hypophthalmus TaxID=310915 RepID=UPI0014816976|nr:patched domain-containing protein 3 [Pangasianodon hypophthalmus]